LQHPEIVEQLAVLCAGAAIPPSCEPEYWSCQARVGRTLRRGLDSVRDGRKSAGRRGTAADNSDMTLRTDNGYGHSVPC